MLLDHLKRAAAEREAQSLTRRRRIAHTACAPHQSVGAVDATPTPLLTFCSNDYLGLADHASIAHALAKWRFKPATRGGVPEESWKIMTVRFTLDS